jgi:hypothetical protein
MNESAVSTLSSMFIISSLAEIRNETRKAGVGRGMWIRGGPSDALLAVCVDATARF